MSEFIANFHFLRPWWLILLVLPVILYWKYFRGARNKSSWEKVCDPNLLDYLLIKGSSTQRKSIGYLAMSAFVVSVVAISGPTWKKVEVPNMTPEKPIMILLNLSSDMEEEDLTPNRLERAKFEISDLLTMIGGAQVGMIVYSEEPFLITPITDDIKLIENLLPEIHMGVMPVNGDRLDRAIDKACEKLNGAGYEFGRLIIFTADAGQRFDLAIKSAKTAAMKGYNIDIVEINSSSIDKLKIIADNGRGNYIKISADDKDMQRLANMINNTDNGLKLSDNLRAQWMDFGYYLVWVPLLACLYFFRKGIVFALLIMVAAQSAEARFLLNKNQQGLREYNKEQYEKALENFEDPTWRGTTYYRIGNYEGALNEFNSIEGKEAIYNVGNALAKLGRIENAIEKYEEVLIIDPNHEDSKFNLEYLKQQQQNQNKEQNQDQQQDQDQDQDQQQEQNSEQNQDENNDQDQQDQQQNSQQDQARLDEENQRNDPKNEQSQLKGPQETENNEQEAEKELAAEVTEESKEQEFDEEVQARAQQYRDIPENPGGLLKAFIQKEYNKKRYEK